MVFVTGGSGLIGSFLISKLLEKGTSVIALYRKEIPAKFLHVQNIEWVQGDILDSALLRKIIRNVTEVYHCAGLVSYAPQDAALLKDINIIGTANIVDACLENPAVKLCHVSSIAAIGQVKGAEVIDENAKWDAALEHSLYASSKYFGELEVWRGVVEGLNAVIVNPSIVLGPGPDLGRSSTQLFKYVVDGRSFYTEGSANFVDVRDVVEAMINLMQTDITGERYIINADLLSYKEFFDSVAICLNQKAPSIKVPNGLTELIWRLEYARAFFTGKRPLITKETARIAKKKHLYSNKKIINALQMQFRPLNETIAWCCTELKSLQAEAK